MRYTKSITLLSGDVAKFIVKAEKNGDVRIQVYSTDHDGEDLLIQAFLTEKEQMALQNAIADAKNASRCNE